jgi:hypothetical protein
MNPDRVTKLYASLTNKERATLAFQYLTDRNTQEVEKVKASIPCKNYRCPDIEYEKWFDAIWDMSSLYAIEHWTLQARKYMAFFKSWMLRRKNDYVHEADEAFDEFILGDEYIRALDCALVSVCTEYGISVEAVKKLADTGTFPVRHPDLQPDEKKKAEFVEMLSRLLPKQV